MTSVSGAATAAYTYTGDGQRIVATEGVTTTVYLSNYLEWAKNTSTQAVTSKSYYYAGTTRVAMRQEGGAPLWLFGDHLGSTSVVANYDGSAHGKLGYQAWGETRFASGDIPTSFQYTGQRNEASIGLHYYGARWYDSSLGRFAQADTIIPEDAQGVQAWDRYAGMNNNAVNYADPSGHSQVLGECTFKNCASPKLLWTWDNLAALYGITFGGKGKWTEEAKAAVVLAANRIGRAFLEILSDLLGEEIGSTRDAFVKVFGKITIILTDSDRNGCDAGYQVITCGGATVIDSRLIAHELGHVFAYRYDNKPYNKLREAKIMDRGGHLVAGDSGSGYLRTTSGFKGNVPPYMYHGPIDFEEDWNVGSIAWHEDWADMFMNWAFDSFDLTLEANGAGWSRYWWMMTNMAEFIQ
ncbi:MAG: RHS repeat-associated core domain-containing protein [Chloroflexota bacterium]